MGNDNGGGDICDVIFRKLKCGRFTREMRE